MSKLSWVWGEREGEIIISKPRGKITVRELMEFLSESKQYNMFAGALAVIQWRVHDAEMTFDGYMGEEGDSDSVIIDIVGDDSRCPVCGDRRLWVQYCPECGHPMWEGKP